MVDMIDFSKGDAYHDYMKVDQRTMAAHRRAMLEQAGKLFRERGLDGVTIAEISNAAGMTHGAFYGHFASKTVLAAEACRHLLESAALRWRRRVFAAKRSGADPVSVLIEGYLTPAARDSRDRSCALASLGSEASRDPDLLPAVTAGARALMDVLTDLIMERRPDDPADEREQAALSALAAMSGGLTLARVLADDPRLSAVALQAATSLAKRAINGTT
jgi:TetR/AcrR family transcriptional repressor of nem operon